MGFDLKKLTEEASETMKRALAEAIEKCQTDLGRPIGMSTEDVIREATARLRAGLEEKMAEGRALSWMRYHLKDEEGRWLIDPNARVTLNPDGTVIISGTDHSAGLEYGGRLARPEGG